MARPLLADPAFVAKAAAGRADEINTCIACNQACLDHVFANRLASCLVNPRACRETTLVLAPTRTAKTVAVVGAGPAGLAAAVSAAERGLAVTLFDRSAEIGGQFRLAMRVPGKEDFAETLRYYARRLAVLGVDVRLSTTPSEADLAAYDEVVVATGVAPRVPELDGVNHPKVVSYADVLDGSVVPGRRVAVIGAGGIGVDVSHFLTHALRDGRCATSSGTGSEVEDWMAHWGVGDPTLHPGGLTERKPRTPVREVTLQRKTTPIGIGLGKTSGWAHRAVLKQSGVVQVSGATYGRVDDDGLHVTVDGAERMLAQLGRPGDGGTAVVIGGGYLGIEMAEALRLRGLQVTLVDRGDQLMASLDADMAAHVQEAAENAGIRVLVSTDVHEIAAGGDGRPRAVSTSAGDLPADHVVLSTGARPATDLAAAAGLALGATGAVRVDDHQRCPGHEGVYAAGDCAETRHRLLAEPVNVQLGTHANKQGRVAGTNATGGDVAFPGVIGTAVSRLCRYEVARTGLTVNEAQAAGVPVVSATIEGRTRAGYYPGRV